MGVYAYVVGNGCVVASTMQWLCYCIHNATVLRNLRAALAFVRKQISNVGGLSCGEVARERTRTEQECVARGAMEWNRLSVWVLQLHQPRDVRRGVRQLPEHARDLLNLWHAAHLSHHHHLLSLPRGTPRPPPTPRLAFSRLPSPAKLEWGKETHPARSDLSEANSLAAKPPPSDTSRRSATGRDIV